jgi:hypothetical protein
LPWLEVGLADARGIAAQALPRQGAIASNRNR